MVKRRNEAQLKFRLTACIPIRKDQGMVQTITTLSCTCLALPKRSAEILRLSFYFVFYQLGLKHRDNPFFSSPWLSTCRSHLLVHTDLSSEHRYLQDWCTPKPSLQLGSATPGCGDTEQEIVPWPDLSLEEPQLCSSTSLASPHAFTSCHCC